MRNAAQRKLLDELGIAADDVPVDQFIPLGRMLYKAPSDGKWGEHERNKSCLKSQILLHFAFRTYVEWETMKLDLNIFQMYFSQS